MIVDGRGLPMENYPNPVPVIWPADLVEGAIVILLASGRIAYGNALRFSTARFIDGQWRYRFQRLNDTHSQSFYSGILHGYVLETVTL